MLLFSAERHVLHASSASAGPTRVRQVPRRLARMQEMEVPTVAVDFELVSWGLAGPAGAHDAATS